MAETKTELRNTAPVRLLPLDMANALLPYDRALSDYLTGKAGAEYPRRKGIWHPAAEFLYELRWKELDASLTASGWDDFDSAKGRSGNKHLWQQVRIGPAPPQARVEKEQERLPAMPRPRPVVQNRAPSGKPAFEVPIIRDLGKTEEPPAPKPAPARPAAPAPVAKPAMAPAAPAAPAAAKPVPVAKPVAPPPAVAKPVAAPIAPPKPVVAPKPAPAVAAKTAAAVVEKPAVEARTVEAPAPVAPAPEPVRPVVPKPAPPAPPARPVERVEAPAPVAEPAKAEPMGMPSFGGSSTYADSIPEPGGASTAVKAGILIGILAVLGGGGYYFFSGGEAAPATKKASTETAQTLTVGEQGWVLEWASDAGGSRRGRQLTLYRPSLTLSDYTLRFTGTIETGALGWVFRAADTKNYYAMKIAVTRPGPVPSLAITRLAVVDGRESSYNEKPLAVPVRADLTFRVEVEVKGPHFTVSVQGQPVDVWTDNRLKTGGIGFMNERDERARTVGVQFLFDKNKR